MYKCFGVKFSMELTSFALEALVDPTEPGFLDSHPGCVSFQEQRRKPNWNSQREVFLQMLSEDQSSP